MTEGSETGILVLIFISGAMFIGSFTRHILKRANIPYTVVLLFIGLFSGLMSHFIASSNPNSYLVQVNAVLGGIDPKLVLFIFLPILIFESAFSLDVHFFKRLFVPIAILAVPSLIVCIAITAFSIKYIFPWEWSWAICLLFAALISATDPVAVVALLKEIGSRKRLETLIEGESLLNDGTAIVFFTIFLALATNPSLPFSLSNIFNEFLVVVSFGICVGLVAGYFTAFWWGRVFNDPMIEISLSIMSALASFLIAEHFFHVSGVVAVVTCAIVLAGYGRTKISPEVSDFLHHFWQMMGFIAETIIFLVVGIIIGHRVNFSDPQLWIMLALLYLIIMIVRAIAVGLFYPIIKRLNIGFDKSKAVVLTWGGLRGVVGLTLALAAIQNPKVNPELGDQILFLTAGIVVLTIAINGSTMLMLVQKLGLDKLPIAKFLTMRRAKLKIDEELRKYYPSLREVDILKDASWPDVETLAGIDDAIIKEDIRAEGRALLEVEEEDLARACKVRILQIERSNYWSQLHDGMLGNTATGILVKSVEHALDDYPMITPRPSLIRHWVLPKTLSKISKFPVVGKLAFKYIFIELAIGYELAKGFLHAQNVMLQNLPAIAPDLDTRRSIVNDIEENQRMTIKHLNTMREHFPGILSMMETYAAGRSLLYKKRYLIQQLVHTGLLDERETKKMIAHVEEKLQNLNKEVIKKFQS